MSDNTAPQGSESLNVEQAASAFFGLMDSEPNAEGQVEQNADSENDDGVDSELVDSEEVEKEQTSTFRVKAAGEEREVTLDQLIEGYQLGADYTKKTQTLSEQRRAVEAERSKIDEANKVRDQYAQRLQMMEQLVTNFKGCQKMSLLWRHGQLEVCQKFSKIGSMLYCRVYVHCQDYTLLIQ